MIENRRSFGKRRRYLTPQERRQNREAKLACICMATVAAMLALLTAAIADADPSAAAFTGICAFGCLFVAAAATVDIR